MYIAELTKHLIGLVGVWFALLGRLDRHPASISAAQLFMVSSQTQRVAHVL
jgi:hypothetical protein